MSSTTQDKRPPAYEIPLLVPEGSPADPHYAQHDVTSKERSRNGKTRNKSLTKLSTRKDSNHGLTGYPSETSLHSIDSLASASKLSLCSNDSSLYDDTTSLHSIASNMSETVIDNSSLNNAPRGPLPDGWRAALTRDGQPFYVNAALKISTWLDPRTNKPTPGSQKPRRHLPDYWDIPLPDGWELGWAEHCNPYFIDHNTCTTSWTDPRFTLHAGTIHEENALRKLEEIRTWYFNHKRRHRSKHHHSANRPPSSNSMNNSNNDASISGSIGNLNSSNPSLNGSSLNGSGLDGGHTINLPPLQELQILQQAHQSHQPMVNLNGSFPQGQPPSMVMNMKNLVSNPSSLDPSADFVTQYDPALGVLPLGFVPQIPFPQQMNPNPGVHPQLNGLPPGGQSLVSRSSNNHNNNNTNHAPRMSLPSIMPELPPSHAQALLRQQQIQSSSPQISRVQKFSVSLAQAQQKPLVKQLHDLSLADPNFGTLDDSDLLDYISSQSSLNDEELLLDSQFDPEMLKISPGTLEAELSEPAIWV